MKPLAINALSTVNALGVGLEATARLARAAPQVRVLILSMHQNEEYVRQALRNGAAGYMLKDAAPMELDLALRAVLRGETYLSPAVSRGVVSDYLQRLREDAQPGDQLTPRQRVVLQLIAEGHSTKEIARRLEEACGCRAVVAEKSRQ